MSHNSDIWIVSLCSADLEQTAYTPALHHVQPGFSTTWGAYDWTLQGMFEVASKLSCLGPETNLQLPDKQGTG